MTEVPSDWYILRICVNFARTFQESTFENVRRAAPLDARLALRCCLPVVISSCVIAVCAVAALHTRCFYPIFSPFPACCHATVSSAARQNCNRFPVWIPPSVGISVKRYGDLFNSGEESRALCQNLYDRTAGTLKMPLVCSGLYTA